MKVSPGLQALTFALLLVMGFDPLFGQGVIAGPQPGLQSLDGEGKMRIGESERCPVCAMPVARYPKSSCAIQLKDKTTYYFCAAGCLMRAWLHPADLLGVPAGTIEAVVVRDYFSGEQIDGRSAVWVAGSDVIGPMGPAPVPLKKDLEAFQRRHGGKAVFRLEQLDDTLWKAITGRKSVR